MLMPNSVEKNTIIFQALSTALPVWWHCVYQSMLVLFVKGELQTKLQLWSLGVGEAGFPAGRKLDRW